MTGFIGVMRSMWWRVLAVAVLLAGCATEDGGPRSTPTTDGETPTPSPADPPAPRSGVPEGADRVVERVVDGDTIVVDGGERVRLIGIDTPESTDPRRPVECFGQEAVTFMESLLTPETEVRLVADVEAVDRYDRTLAYVYRLSDGLFVNLELVEEGYAQVFTVSPNVEHADEFKAAAGRAREAGRGLWAAC